MDTRHSLARLAAIVLNYRTPADTLAAVASLRTSQRPIDDLIVVDNDPDDECQRALAVDPVVTYLSTAQNLGFSGGMNVGIRTALARGADAVLLVNSDATVPPDCIAFLVDALESTAGAGIAGPVLRSLSQPDLIASAGMTYAPRSGRMRHRLAGTRQPSFVSWGVRRVDGVSGCVMLVTRRVFESIGLLEEDYFYSFEDLAFCLTARRAGFTSVVAEMATAYHEGGRSIGADSPRRLYFAARNHLLLATRHGSPGVLAARWRALSIVALNVAHAVIAPGGSLPARLRAVAHGTRDYLNGSHGSDA